MIRCFVDFVYILRTHFREKTKNACGKTLLEFMVYWGSSTSRLSFIFLSAQPSFWRITSLFGVRNFLARTSKKHINWQVHVRPAALLLLLPAAPLLSLLFFWRLSFLPNKGENKNDLSSKQGILVDIPRLMSNGCNTELSM